MVIYRERYHWQYFWGERMDKSGKDRTLGVPRGLLRFLVLKMLSEKPMAGFEVVEEIEKQTNGQWKPSPGSIYPLMAWMLRKGYTKDLPRKETGYRRYSFTPAGHSFFEQQINLSQDFMRKMEFLTPILVGGLQLGAGQDKKRLEIREPAQKLLRAFLSITNNLEKLSEKETNEIIIALRDCSERLGTIAQKSKIIDNRSFLRNLTVAKD